MDIEVFEELL